ncbi:amino acid ABC transporter substrate-binding protein [Domibacillus sp. A3M-37]|uniref:amino acid ABC transporter substrate-binding protein n=1 Tax=Domibacillus TaxID=1433999 RepID=UPI0020B8B8E0|nr:amino acid ABC transporter substrate-binding protein [Domibacillus sp. A3M-37]MCP3764924.1 amino acid ABC transporter substrate-binding protein [Domibacillus sp. A3M-37]
MKKLTLTVFTLILLLALAACGGNNANEDKKEEENKQEAQSSYEKIKEKGVITIGTEGTYSPFTFHDKSGKLTGFDVEVATEVFKRLDIKPQFVETKWDGMIAGLDARRYDMIANQVGINDERKEKYDFSDPYTLSKAVLVVREDNNEIKSLDDLKGRTVAQSLTSNYRQTTEEHGAEITGVESFNQAIDLVTSRRADATLNDSLSYLDLKKQRPELPIKVAYTENDAAESAFLFRKDNEELIEAVNGALGDMQKDGTFEKISNKWFGADVSK